MKYCGIAMITLWFFRLNQLFGISEQLILFLTHYEDIKKKIEDNQLKSK